MHLVFLLNIIMLTLDDDFVIEGIIGELQELLLPCGFSELAMDLFVNVDVKCSLDERQGHLQGFHT